jgi:serine/threonine-protein phosphatase 4 catalytic subunit
VARAHQLVMEGYKLHFESKLITVWSAPNYCYKCGNVASILELDEQIGLTFKKFNASPEHYKQIIKCPTLPEYFL